MHSTEPSCGNSEEDRREMVAGITPCSGIIFLPKNNSRSVRVDEDARSLSPTHLVSQLCPSCSTKASMSARLSAVEGGAPVGPCMSVRIYSPVPPTNKGTRPLEIISCKKKETSLSLIIKALGKVKVSQKKIFFSVSNFGGKFVSKQRTQNKCVWKRFRFSVPHSRY